MTACLLITALYLQKVSVPVPAYDSKRKWYWKKFPIFSVFTVSYCAWQCVFLLLADISVLDCDYVRLVRLFGSDKDERVRQ